MAQYRLYWPPISRDLKLTAGVLFGLWFLSILLTPLGAFAADYMLISKSAIFEQGQIWTLVTYALWHADFGHLFFNLFVLWIFGSDVEQAWTRRAWWRFCALCALGGGVAIALSQLILSTNHPTLGYSGVVMGVVAAYCWYNWNRRLHIFFIAMTGKTLLLLFIGFDVFMVVVSREPISIAGHLGGMATGLLLVTGFWRPERLKKRFRRWQQRRRFKLLSKDESTSRKRNGVDHLH